MSTLLLVCEEPTCRKSFSAKSRAARYCSPKCRSRAFRRDGKKGNNAQQGLGAREAGPQLPEPPPVIPGDHELRNRVLQMRMAGASYDAIAKALDAVNDADHAAQLAQLGLKQLEALAEWESENRVPVEQAKMDLLERNVTAVLQNAASGGDPQLVLAAVDRILRISAARQLLDGREQAAPAAVDPLQAAQEAVRLRLVASKEAG